MSEKAGEHFEDEPKQEQAQETELQPQAEMPEDFVEPKGKSGKWGEVVENKELGVRYREKVIELPKHRQEETGIKRIRRRELLPPFPERLLDERGTHEANDPFGFSESGRVEVRQAQRVWSSDEKFDDIYKFFTNEGYPSPGTLVHTMNPNEVSNDTEESNKNIEKFKKEGLYFQKIENVNMFFGGVRIWLSRYNTPVFVFGNRNNKFNEYIDSVLADENISPRKKKYLQLVKDRKIGVTSGGGEYEITSFGKTKDSKIGSLRWCHAELALVPTKRSLNVLFFETGEEDKEKE